MAASNPSPDDHPLLNEFVIEKLMQKLSIREWKTMRLVCKTWMKHLLPQWRNDMPMILNHVPKKNCCKCGGSCGQNLTLTEFLDLQKDKNAAILDIKSHPYRQFKLIGLKLRKDCKIQLRFWTMCGPHMTHLSFKWCTYMDIGTFFQILLQYAPNLHSLDLGSGHLQPDYNSSNWKPQRIRRIPNVNAVDFRKFLDLKQLDLGKLCGLYNTADEQSKKGFLRNHDSMGYMLPMTWFELLGHYPCLHVSRNLNLSNIMNGERRVKINFITSSIRSCQWKWWETVGIVLMRQKEF